MSCLLDTAKHENVVFSRQMSYLLDTAKHENRFYFKKDIITHIISFEQMIKTISVTVPQV